LASQIPGKSCILRAPEEALARYRHHHIAVLAALLAAAGLAQIAAHSLPAMAEDGPPPTGLREDVVFRDYPALANNSEILRRVFTPLTAAAIKRELSRTGKSLSETSFDLAAEKFLVYVPPVKPPQGYGLIVFVPPWQKSQLPNGWGPMLDQFGMIFVTAAHSGNQEDVVSRREPLALIAALNVMAQYPVDPSRVLVGGMSGGSRMAQRLALAYPDLFRGALLNSGSDVIGTIVEPLPPAPLFRQFQTATRLLYVTGDEDTANVETETRSKRSMQDWCISDVNSMRMSFTGHEVAPATVFARALQSLLDPHRPDPERLAACRAGIEAEAAAGLGRVDALVAAGKRSDARAMLKDIDAKFGGLAAPHSVELDAILNGAPP
jgi:predicted esterase